MGTSVQMTLIEWIIQHGEPALGGVTDAVDTIRKAVLLQIKTDWAVLSSVKKATFSIYGNVA